MERTIDYYMVQMAVKRGRVMQICVRDHVEVHPQKKKEVLYFVKKKMGEIGVE